MLMLSSTIGVLEGTPARILGVLSQAATDPHFGFQRGCVSTSVKNPTDLTDVELVSRVACADAEAFVALYDRYSPRMFGIIMSVVHDRTTAEDVLQHAMLEVWQRHAARYQPVLGSVEGWMLRLARSRAIDFYRRRNASVKRNEAIREELKSDIEGRNSVSPDDNPSLDVIENAALRTMISDLPEAEREPIVLAYVHGYTREQIAEQTGQSIGTIKTRIRRGVIRLKERLLAEGAAFG